MALNFLKGDADAKAFGVTHLTAHRQGSEEEERKCRSAQARQSSHKVEKSALQQVCTPIDSNESVAEVLQVKSAI